MRSYLEREGFDVSTASDGERAVELVGELRPDVVVLDLMLPGIDGIEACRRIRSFSDAYIIMLTARAEEVDKIVGLSTGADDYLTKPFSPGELVARVRAMLRRPRGRRPPSTSTRRFGDLVIDPARVRFDSRGPVVELTRLEFDLLDALSADPRVAFSPRTAARTGLGPDLVRRRARRRRPHRQPAPQARRRPRRARYVRTVRGVGYRMGPGQ